eukprot:TRINITY_DN8668_c0_g2_i2.p2 TRINITY_DN8668_c0_g2~~TRINITY_DN8668_c0_g2_i2.p2  ORF type:complete len:216 (-),score=43.27 TRINITY_DN8668_c0_g2_i2:140-736(-)
MSDDDVLPTDASPSPDPQPEVKVDAKAFEALKQRLLNKPEDSAVLRKIKAKVSAGVSKPGQAQQCPFSFSEQYECCREWGWPEDEYHGDRVIDILKAYLRTLGYTWKIRNVIESNLLPEHHGIGQRIDDFKVGKQYSGVIEKIYQAVANKGDKDAAKQIKESQKTIERMQKGKGTEFKEPKKKEEKKGLFSFGSSKKK